MYMKDNGETSAPPNPEAILNIPLEYRLIHLNIDTSAVYPKVTAGTIANSLGLDGNQVMRALVKYDIPSESLFNERQQQNFDYYPFYITDLIRGQREWREWYLSLPQRMNAHHIAEAVGRSYGWTIKILRDNYPNASQQSFGHRSRLYPRAAVEKLHEMTLSTTPDVSWYSVPQLEELAGHDREWVLNRLARTTIRPEQRRHPIIGREYSYYPPDSVDVLEEASLQVPEPAGDWLTASGLERFTEKSYNWITKRLEGKYIALGEPRLDDMGVERIHYPPSVADALMHEHAAVQAHEKAGDWATISTLSVRLGMHAVTLTKLTREISAESEMRLDKKDRLKQHFSPQAQEQLAAKAIEVYGYPDADGWVTFTVAQKIIGRSAGWINAEFRARNVVGETRLDKSSHPVVHYDPDIIQAMKDYGDTLDAGTMVSILDIMKQTQKSRIWVNARLEEASIMPKKRFSVSGRFIDHYPVSILEQLFRKV